MKDLKIASRTEIYNFQLFQFQLIHFYLKRQILKQITQKNYTSFIYKSILPLIKYQNKNYNFFSIYKIYIKKLENIKQTSIQIYIKKMSLHIIGSCSRITRNIVLQLAKNNQYNQIVINDLLPVYQLHQRFYQLKRQLSDIKANTNVKLDKLISSAQLYQIVNTQSDVLFVTHDYYENVTSKTKLMKLVAQYGKKRSQLSFATPLQYDHYGYSNPEQNYLNAQQQVKKNNPNATFIRSDIQDKTQFFAYYHHSKNIWEDQLFKLSAKTGFAPNVVGANNYAQIVANSLKQKSQGKIVCVQGQDEVKAENVDFNRSLEQIDWCHAKSNIRNIAAKYTGVIGQGAQKLQVSL